MSSNHVALRFEHVYKSFGDRAILNDVSFEVPRGQALCILGRSGTGKSVTLKLAMGLLTPDRGKVCVEQDEIAGLNRTRLAEARKKMGFLFQSAALFDSLSVGENLAFPLHRHTNKSPEEIDAIVKEKLAQVGLEKDKDKMPSDLSGGMRKRAGLARAMVLDPMMLLVDEPSSGLDSITAGEIDHLLAGLKTSQKTTLIVVTHDVTGARRYADRFAVLDGGKLIASGTAEELAHSEDWTVRQLATGEQR